ncbi:CLUMA_CG007018, isoform A [Clunio marinus]|uniref:CLUMA_CG007018, isoform A n=1 Tax=Clunio marinus TaxID=568069 RepID=A0A1J1I149_9DIPT|nr:CLUMA_CG007018, isoform A [Clunio marinus]
MRFPSVNYFLCCFSLETGGKFLGWFGAVGATLLVIPTLIIFGVATYNFEFFLNATQNVKLIDNPIMSSNSQTFVTTTLFLVFIYCAISLYASVELIKGVQNRSSRQLRPYMILVGIEVILVLLQIIHFTWVAFLQTLLGLIINGYIFICLHSLWEQFRDEAMRGHNRQYQKGTMMMKV